MKTKLYIIAAAALISFSAAAQSESHFKPYGFISNNAHMDTRDGVAGIVDLMYFIPKETDAMNPSFHYTAISSRLGLDISGYEYNGFKIGGKVETDFYSGVSGVTGAATLALRQVYLTIAKGSETLKMGQAWHPMSADLPDIFSVNPGAPFNPLSRTPLAQLDSKITENWSNTTALIWQMQYPSCGPEGPSANYVKYCGIPEIYFGINYTNGGFLARLGVDEVFLKPVRNGKLLNETSLFAYVQYKKGHFSAKAKTVFAEDGSHLNLMGGYAVKDTDDYIASDKTTWSYAPTRNSTSFLSLSYGSKFQGVLYIGYTKNFGTGAPVRADNYWFCKNGFVNLLSAARFAPQFIVNFGKLQLGIEYEQTAALYGSRNATNVFKDFDPETGLYDTGRHTVTNHRVQTMVRFVF